MKRVMAAGAALLLGALVMAESLGAPASVRTSVATTAPSTALGKFYAQHLHWQHCHGQLQCARFKVPVDYARPQGATVSIMAARALATGTSRGPLLTNPGGPGASGIEFISDPQYAVSATARRNFDLVSFDPRGVGESSPLWCLKGAQLDTFLNIDPTPTTAAERSRFVEAGRQLVSACKRENALLMAHMSAVDIARDMDVLRALMGQDKLRYLGKSWGTVLGKVYAALFPAHVGSFVLDGAVDLEVPATQAAFDQGQGFETAADRFVAWCVSRGNCVLGPTQAAAKQRLVSFVASLDKKPMPTNNARRPLTEAQALTAIIGPLYLNEGGYQWLLTGLTPAIALHNGAVLQSIFDWFVERNDNGSYKNNANTAIYVTNCLDDPGNVRTVAQAQKLARLWAPKLPLMGAAMAWSDLPCAGWPYRPRLDIAKLVVRDVPPMLVVSATYDPATPMKWGRGLAAELPGAVLLTRVGDGHTSYANGSTCIDSKVDAFLLSSDAWRPTLPGVGTTCDAPTA